MASPHDDTLIPGITMRRATRADADALMAIFQAAARWLIGRGIQQWAPDQFHREPLIAAIERGEVYAAVRGGAIVGTLTLTWADPRVWGEQPDDAGYVHGLALRRDAAGQGIGAAMLAWAGRAVAVAGRPYLRLDCMATNTGLRAYYERAGFVHMRDVGGATWSASLYQKRTVSA